MNSTLGRMHEIRTPVGSGTLGYKQGQGDVEMHDVKLPYEGIVI